MVRQEIGFWYVWEMSGVVRRQMCGTADKPGLNKSNHRRVVHRDVGHVMASGEWRNHDIRQAEAKLSVKAFDGCNVS